MARRIALAELGRLGHPRHRIRFEANGAPSDPAAQGNWPTGCDPTQEVTVTTREGSFRTPRNRPLLDALEDHGITPETACRSGECSLCRVRVVKGEVHSADEAKLREEMKSEEIVENFSKTYDLANKLKG